MNAGMLIRGARTTARLTQRQLAARTGVAQPTIARIEAGAADPRFDTVVRLLDACGHTLASQQREGLGVDRTQIRELLRLSPVDRLRLLRDDVAGMRRVEQAVRR